MPPAGCQPLPGLPGAPAGEREPGLSHSDCLPSAQPLGPPPALLNMASREEVWKLCSQGAQALVPGRIVGLAHLEITQDLSQGGESGSEHLLDHQKTSGWGVRHSGRVTHHSQWLVLVQRLILVQWLVIRGTN